jgi:zinc protease
MKKNHITAVIGIFLLLSTVAIYHALQPTDTVSPIQPSSPAHKQAQAIQQWTTSQGTSVYFVQNNAMPMLDIHLIFDAGSARDKNQLGLANCWLHLLDQGTATLNADQIAAQFENKGAIFNLSLNQDRATIALRSLSDPQMLNPVLDLLAQVIAKPAFTEDSIALMKSQILTEQKMIQQQPSLLAKNAFYKALYGDHPYANAIIGNEQTLQAITQSDLQNFHQQFAVAKNAIITLVGDLSLEQAKAITENILQQLPEGSKAEALPPVAPLTHAITAAIQYPSEQTHLLMGAPCIKVNDPDYFPLLIANYILGDNLLMSRLFKEVREKRGLAYQIHSYLHTMKQPGPFIIKLQTQNHQIKEAIAVVQDTLTRFVNEGPTAQELIDAKEGLSQAFPLSMNSNAKLSMQLDQISFYQQPLDFLDTYQDKLKAVTLAEIQATLKKHIPLETMALITAGPIAP